MSGHRPGTDEPFERSLGLVQVTTSGVALIIGAGVFVLLAPATQRAGGLVWASFVVSAVLCALSAFSYMELSSMFPRAGSEHEFARQVFPQSVSFVVGWAMALALIVATATVSLGFARYLGEFIDIDQRVGALAILMLVSAVALRGSRIDAILPSEESPSIAGFIENGVALVWFKSGYGDGGGGRAILSLAGNQISWRIVGSYGVHYFPSASTLNFKNADPGW